MSTEKINLDQIKNRTKKKQGDFIKVGMSTCGIAAGADKVFETLVREKRNRKINITIEKCGCSGMCHAEPLVEVSVKGMPTVVYGQVDDQTAVKIIDKHALGKYLLNDHIYNIKVS